MRRLFVVIGFLLVFTLPISCPVKAGYDVDSGKEFVYRVWCRHDALYWMSVVGEKYRVRVMIGMSDNVPHSQPQVYMGDEWWYFTMTQCDQMDRNHGPNLCMRIISMPRPGVERVWKPLYPMSYAQFAILQKTWMIHKDGKDLESPRRRKAWNKIMNEIMWLIRDMELPND